MALFEGHGTGSLRGSLRERLVPRVLHSSFQAHFDLERVPNSPHSGQNTHEGVLTVDIRGLGANPPELIYVHLFHDLLAEVSDGQVVVAL